MTGDLEGAQAAYEAAMAINVAAFGPRHIEVAENHANLAAVAAASGNRREARVLLSRAIGVAEEVFGTAAAARVKTDVWVARVEEALANK